MGNGQMRERLRATLGRSGVTDGAIRRLRRSDEVATLQHQAAALAGDAARLRVELAAVRSELARVQEVSGRAEPVEGSAPTGAGVPETVRPFISWAPPGHFYSPVPDLADVERDAERIFGEVTQLPGVELREEAQVATFAALAALAREAPLPAQAGDGHRYSTDNLYYGPGDAMMLQSMLRSLRPSRYLEVGSGWTTALALDTSERFLEGAMAVTAIEPYPELLEGVLRRGDPVEILARPVQDVPLDTFAALRAGDVLFVDSSHVVKTGSDVHHLFTKVLPVLCSGVVVHVHDVFWPFEYLRHWIAEGRAWNEAYLLHAFLMYNGTFEIVLWNHWLAMVHPEIVASELPAMVENPGGALWMRRR
ncbi:MAG: class I SAM-dependent methyltransferase [Acidimicrobiales bacterium]